MERRRRWAASGCLPPAIAARFTLGEQAALAVVAAEHRKRRDCRLTNGELADVAGVSITTVKNALRAARTINLIAVEERRLSAFRNAPNIVRIVSPEWRAWLRLRGGGKSVPRSPTPYKNQRSRTAERAWAAEGQGAEPAARRRDSGGQTRWAPTEQAGAMQSRFGLDGFGARLKPNGAVARRELGQAAEAARDVPNLPGGNRFGDQLGVALRGVLSGLAPASVA